MTSHHISVKSCPRDATLRKMDVWNIVLLDILIILRKSSDSVSWEKVSMNFSISTSDKPPHERIIFVTFGSFLWNIISITSFLLRYKGFVHFQEWWKHIYRHTGSVDSCPTCFLWETPACMMLRSIFKNNRFCGSCSLVTLTGKKGIYSQHEIKSPWTCGISCADMRKPITDTGLCGKVLRAHGPGKSSWKHRREGWYSQDVLCDDVRKKESVCLCFWEHWPPSWPFITRN